MDIVLSVPHGLSQLAHHSFVELTFQPLGRSPFNRPQGREFRKVDSGIEKLFRCRAKVVGEVLLEPRVLADLLNVDPVKGIHDEHLGNEISSFGAKVVGDRVVALCKTREHSP